MGEGLDILGSGVHWPASEQVKFLKTRPYRAADLGSRVRAVVCL